MLQLRSCFRVSVRIFWPNTFACTTVYERQLDAFWLCSGLLLFLSLAGAAKGQQSNHNAYDVALHLQHCTKRPVFFVLSVAEQLTADSLPPCEKGPLDNWLSRRKVKLIWTDSVILLRNIPVPFYTSAQGDPFSPLKSVGQISS